MLSFLSARIHVGGPLDTLTLHVSQRPPQNFFKKETHHIAVRQNRPPDLPQHIFSPFFPGLWLHALYENVLFHLKSLFNWKALEEKGRNAAYGVMCGDLQEWVE